jgi:hypothetical protein
MRMMKSSIVLSFLVSYLSVHSSVTIIAAKDVTSESTLRRTSDVVSLNTKDDSTKSMELQVCVPCHSLQQHHGRQLGFFSNVFSKLIQGLKKIIRPSTTQDKVMDQILTSDFIQGNNETTIGRIFTVINSNPLFQVGAIALGLLTVVVLVAVEGTSIATGTPILCLLNLVEITPIYGACSDFPGQRLRALEGTYNIYAPYFNGTIESLHVPEAASKNATKPLMDVIQYGLSDDVVDMMNNVTITTVLDKIANSEKTRPFLAMTVLALLPVLMVNNISCKGRNCNRRSLKSLESSDPVVVVEACEMEYINCEVNNLKVLVESMN